MKTVFALIGAVLVSVSVSAQWPSYLRPDVPRTADGKPNLSAPAPRLANGKPDFSGVWESRVPPSGRPGAALPNIGDGPPVATFFNIAANIKEGLPMTPWATELRRQRMSVSSQDNPDANCLPLGFMQLHTHSQPRKIVHTKDDLVIMYEANYGLRQIFTDGRSLPANPNDVQPWWYGYSLGKWDGDTLVVETVGLRDEGWLDVAGAPFTSGARITEKFRRMNYGRLEIDITIDDAKAYTRPWTVRVNQRLFAGDELIEFICNENERSSKHYVR